MILVISKIFSFTIKILFPDYPTVDSVSAQLSERLLCTLTLCSPYRRINNSAASLVQRLQHSKDLSAMNNRRGYVIAMCKIRMINEPV